MIISPLLTDTDISSKYLYCRHNPTTLQKNLHLNQKGSWINYWHPSDWWMILGWSGFKVYLCIIISAGHNPTKFTLNMELNVRYCLFHIYNYMGTSEIYILMCFIWRIIIKHQNIKFTFQTHVGLWHLQIFMENDYKS